jgi:hypothetical protein
MASSNYETGGHMGPKSSLNMVVNLETLLPAENRTPVFPSIASHYNILANLDNTNIMKFIS